MSYSGLAFLLLGAVALCIYAFYFVSSPSRETKPDTRKTPAQKPVERRPTKPSTSTVDYTAQCRQIDSRVKRFCSEHGVRSRNYRIVAQRARSGEGKAWLYTEATIVFSHEVEPGAVADALIKTLGDIPALSHGWRHEGKSSGYLRLKLQGIPTHLYTIMSRPFALAVIIDDVGRDLSITRQLLDLGMPLTLSILPDLAYSQESEILAHQRGCEVMLHLPMEPRETSSLSPGTRAINHGMNRATVNDIVSDHLKAFRHISGVNNHMGSRATEDVRLMTWVMEAIQPAGLYFVDSRTSSQSVACRVAKTMGIPSRTNMFFIDNELEVAYCKDYIDKAIVKVKKQGSGIVIGHARPTTIQALREMRQQIYDEGIDLVFASELVQ